MRFHCVIRVSARGQERRVCLKQDTLETYLPDGIGQRLRIFESHHAVDAEIWIAYTPDTGYIFRSARKTMEYQSCQLMGWSRRNSLPDAFAALLHCVAAMNYDRQIKLDSKKKLRNECILLEFQIFICPIEIHACLSDCHGAEREKLVYNLAEFLLPVITNFGRVKSGC